jgi:hypothetical protein
MQSNNKLLWLLFGNLAFLLSFCFGKYQQQRGPGDQKGEEGLGGGGELEPPAPTAERVEALNDAVFNGEDAADDEAEGDGGELELNQEPNQQEEPEPNQGWNQEEEPEPEGLNQEEGLEQQPLQQFRQHLQELVQQGGNVRDIGWYTTLVRILERRGNGEEMTSTDRKWLHNQWSNYKNEGSRGLQVGGPRRRDLELSGLLNMRIRYDK